MKTTEMTLHKYVDKLTKQSSQQLWRNFEELTKTRSDFEKLLNHGYYILLHQVSEFVVYCDSGIADREFCVDVTKLLSKVLDETLFDEPRIFRVLHKSIDPTLPDWDLLSEKHQNSYAELYKRMTNMVYCTLIFQSVGYTDTKVAAMLKDLLGPLKNPSNATAMKGRRVFEASG